MTPAIGSPRRVCLVPHLSGVGGMVSFQYKLAAGLQARQVQVCFDLADRPYQAVLVIGGTRQLAGLWRARRQGIPIVQRLDGMNWMHRLPNRQGGRADRLRHIFRAEYGNWLLAFIRARLADRIVYQSDFSKSWWERIHGITRVEHRVIYNGVDLETYIDAGPHSRPVDRCRILMVEGSLMGGYEAGLEVAVALARGLAARPEMQTPGKPVELMVVGRVAPGLQRAWDQQIGSQAGFTMHWAGLVGRAQIPEIDRSAHLLYSADVNAACPNAVIEALACGLPVVAFDTGALPELVRGAAGRVVPYGGDPWKLEPPDVDGLVQAAYEIVRDQSVARPAARRYAQDFFGLEQMTAAYLEMLLAV